MAQLKCRMRLLLTGTPLQNSVTELWALLHYLLPDLFSHLMDFKAWFVRPFKDIEGFNEFEIQIEAEQEQQIIERMHTLLSPFLLQRLKKDVLADKLLPRVEVTLRVPLSAWQQSAYTDLERRTIKLISGDAGAASSEQINNALMQLRKIALHPYLFQATYEVDEGLVKSSGKLEALDRLLPKLLKFKHKVLIFSQFTSMLNILQDYLKWKGISQVRLDGQVSHEVRTDRIQAFQTDPRIEVFLLSARAGGLGLNLQAADTVILFDLDWNPQNDKQAVARAHRVGQTKEVRVIRLISDSGVERHMEARCKEKLDMEEKIMGAGMFRRQVTADQRRTALRAVLGLPVVEKAPASSGSKRGKKMPADATTCAPVSEEVPAAPLADIRKVEELTTPEQFNEMIARGPQELADFQKTDVQLLKPKRGAGKDAPLLVKCGRLMRPADVPKGFVAKCDEDD
eukprot:TRINITY_DN14423_c1_g1_i1.p1 TRINITY_DN14423_c1_g1~~TRINITY_DN14423_c1_g1_i1.p1  ORF type:complete len:455 (-),score=114.66 TRINITY_DN14423_c1_g1_i1:135-1499(-)